MHAVRPGPCVRRRVPLQQAARVLQRQHLISKFRAMVNPSRRPTAARRAQLHAPNALLAKRHLGNTFIMQRGLNIALHVACIYTLSTPSSCISEKKYGDKMETKTERFGRRRQQIEVLCSIAFHGYRWALGMYIGHTHKHTNTHTHTDKQTHTKGVALSPAQSDENPLRGCNPREATACLQACHFRICRLSFSHYCCI